MRARAGLSALAFLGTAAYAASFFPLGDTVRLARIATAIGISAGVSWLILGIVIATMERRKSGRLALWFDTCLVAMAWGEAFLLFAAAFNFTISLRPDRLPSVEFFGPFHAALLLGADCTMAAVFARRAARFGVPVRRSLVLWILVLNGTFVALLYALAAPLGYS